MTYTGFKKSSVFIILLLILSSLAISLPKISKSEADTLDYWISCSLDKEYVIRGEYINITTTTNASDYILQIYLPDESLYYNQSYPANSSYIFPLLVDAPYGKYTVKALAPEIETSTSFWLQQIDELQAITVPYSWNWKGIDYVLQENYTLSATNFDGQLSLDWLSEIFTKLKPNATLYENPYLVKIHLDGKDIDADVWLMKQSGLKIRMNGTLAKEETLKWNFKSLGDTQLLWMLDGFSVGHLVFSWSDFSSSGITYVLDKTGLKLDVYLETSFDIDPYLFESGYEPGDFSEWSGVTTSAGCTTEVIQTDPHHGDDHAHYATDVDGSAAYSYISSGLDASEIYVRIKIKFNTIPTGNRESGGIYFYAGGTRLLVMRMKTGGNPSVERWRMEGRNGAAMSDPAIYSDAYPVVGTWYDIELYALIHPTAGIYQFYVDGNLELERTGYDTDNFGNVDEVRVGIRYSQEVVSMYVDCVVIDSSYIGVEASNVAPTNDGLVTDATFNVDVYGWSKLTVTDTDLVDDLKTVDIQVTTFDSKVFTLRWTQATGVFSELSDSSGICTLDVSGSQRVNIDTDTDRIEFKFMISVGAQKGVGSIQATSTDDADATDVDNYSSEFSINFYSSLTLTDSTHSWISLSPGDTEVLVDGGGGSDGDIDFLVSANAAFDVEIKGDGALTSGSDTIPLNSVKAHLDTVGSAVSLSTSYQNLPGFTSQSRGVDLAKSFKLWLSTPNPQESGSYSYTMSLQITET